MVVSIPLSYIKNNSKNQHHMIFKAVQNRFCIACAGHFIGCFSVVFIIQLF